MTTPQSEEQELQQILHDLYLSSTGQIEASSPLHMGIESGDNNALSKITKIMQNHTNQKLQEFVVLAEQALTNLHGVKNPELTGTVLEETMFTNKQWASEASSTLRALLAQMQEKK